jgi:hypothetical protein
LAARRGPQDCRGPRARAALVWWAPAGYRDPAGLRACKAFPARRVRLGLRVCRVFPESAEKLGPRACKGLRVRLL